MENITSFLTELEENSVNLFFLEKNKDRTTNEISYNVLNVEIDEDLGNELSDEALLQIENKLAKEPDFREYGVLTGSDSSYIEKLGKNDVPFLNEILNQLNSELGNFSFDESKEIHGYIVRIENEGETLYLFRKYDPKRVLKRGIISKIVNQGRYGKSDDNLLLIDPNFDALLYIGNEVPSEESENSSETVFIFNRRNFEYLFSFTDYYENEVTNSEAEIEGRNIVGNTSTLVDFCKKNSNMARKMVRIMQDGFYRNMTPDSIQTIVDGYDLDDISFDSEGKLIVTPNNTWTVLKILDDDYLESGNTSNKYESHSKVKK
ncbi:MAG: DUF4868 domain-containing protein [Euryarchaeota archaeon]|nr:DUF4868 domain-containing protein [Euryarchaeota archaeon]MBU4547453.1 DUF4868 domain-containing protein [Euryarchaeota archaeon]MBU4607429.1 DUF4868 domain-containing protein [Euryarchaeota archaeon]MBV1730133.1 DUF4868 domain-containing protein [Methanobacterium sp.]MBV1754064.1 DUF4868 domain-containing protein [Methanobacterium sp.]